MFNNIGKKLKALATTIFALFCAAGLIAGIVCLSIGAEPYIALILILPTPIIAWVSAAFIYGFGELIEKTAETARNTAILALSDSKKPAAQPPVQTYAQPYTPAQGTPPAYTPPQPQQPTYAPPAQTQRPPYAPPAQAQRPPYTPPTQTQRPPYTPPTQAQRPVYAPPAQSQAPVYAPPAQSTTPVYAQPAQTNQTVSTDDVVN